MRRLHHNCRNLHRSKHSEFFPYLQLPWCKPQWQLFGEALRSASSFYLSQRLQRRTGVILTPLGADVTLKQILPETVRVPSAEKGEGLMRLIVFVVAVLVTLSPAAAFTQVKQRVDEKGVVHYEAVGPAQPKTPNTTQPKPNARRPIDRNHAGLTLGDNEASFTAAKNGDYVGKSGADGNYYRYTGTLPEGAVAMGVLFVAGRLAFLNIEYRDFGLGGWQQLVKETTEKYGPPMGDAQTATWNDGVTALSFRHDPGGNIVIVLEDFSVMAKYSEQEKAALPKF